MFHKKGEQFSRLNISMGSKLSCAVYLQHLLILWSGDATEIAALQRKTYQQQKYICRVDRYHIHKFQNVKESCGRASGVRSAEKELTEEFAPFC